jgi:superfamily II DNA or RNA helicase
MPTGSGKTAVLALSPFLLRARRVLLVTPSRLVRHQVAEEFRSLAQLRRAKALPDDIPRPSVREVKHRVGSEEQWQSLAPYDVVVGTPLCVSPIVENVVAPPDDFFDLVLMDEAHHSPASTWAALLNAFPRARKLLVTATPFRRDRREIQGRFIFEYPVSEAYRDGVFGHIDLVAVDDSGSASANDVAIAVKAENVLNADREHGLDHYLMIRTDLQKRAEELLGVYQNNTALRIRRVDSSYSAKYVDQAVEDLKAKKLDGIIAVDMLGEGFDFPNLKIAAVHSPHKSLAATLQFVGRFARTGGPAIGQAKFVAVVQEIKGALRDLYVEGAEWQEIVPALTDARVREEIDVREMLGRFQRDPEIEEEKETEGLSLYGIRPYSHVKIYRVGKDIDVSAPIDMPGSLVVKHREVLDDGNTVVFITREETQPAWAPLGRFARVEWDLFIVHLHRESGLLFICTSRRLEVIYRDLALKLAGEDHDILPVPVINRVLRGIDGPEAFSVGIRNRIHTAAESYRIMLGPNAVRALTRSHGRMYHRGHGMFRGMRGEEPVTIGFSSSSKVWSNRYQHIPGLVSWFNEIAAKLVDERAVHTNSNWDFIPMSERIDHLPDKPVIAIDFDAVAYEHAPIIRVPNGTGTTEHSLLDCDIELVDPQPTEAIRFRIAIDGGPAWIFDFTLRPQVTITFVGGPALPSVEWEESAVPLDDWLVLVPPNFYYPDFSALIGREQVVPDLAGVVFDRDRIEIVDWAAEGVDIHSEVRNPQKGKRSIHLYLAVRLRAEGHTIVVYDDGSGEVADFVTIDETDAAIAFTLYHAKGSKGVQPGERVADVYEVCGQAVKSTRWATDAARLIDRLLNRLRKRPAEHLITGTIDDLKRLRSSVRHKEVSYTIALVQPGISRAAMSRDVIALPMAAADVYIVGGGMFEDLRVIGSV